MKRTHQMTLAYFLFIFSAAIGIICVIFELSTLVRLITVGLVVISVIAILNLARCPHCHRYGIRVQPFQKQAPYCKKCGKRIEES